MLAAEILEVPISLHHHRYLLAVMEYFTKWAEAIPFRNKTAASTLVAVINICCSFDVHDIVHSDQQNNFDSHLFHQVLSGFEIHKSCTTAYHSLEDGMVNRYNHSLL